MFSRKPALWAALLALGLAGSAHADYVGQTINGTLAFGPYGALGGQYWPTTSIVDPGTFTYKDIVNIDTAQFDGTTLTVTDNVLSSANGWLMTFSAPAMPFTYLALESSSFASGLTYSVSGGTINVGWNGTMATGTQSATFNIVPSGVPEPGTTWLMGAGLVGLLGVSRRSRQRKNNV